jgi:hypothetical protein
MKRLVVLAASVAALLWLITSAYASPSPCYVCDLDGNRKVNSVDTAIAKVRRYPPSTVQHIRSHFGDRWEATLPTITNTPTPTRTFTATATSTPMPPTPTNTPPPPSPLPPALPTPPAGKAHAAYIGITPAGFVSPWDADIYAEIDCGIAKSISYYLAEQTGYTIWFDCYQIVTQGDAIDIGSEPSQGRSGVWLDGFAGVHVFGSLIGDLGFKPALVPDPDGPGPLRGGQGLNRNAIDREVEAQLRPVLLHNRDGSPRGIRVHSVRNGGGYAGGGTYCLTALGAQIACDSPHALGNFGFAHLGDWGFNYYAGVVTLEGRPRPLSFTTPLTPNVIEAMDWGCWDKYADDSGRAGLCDNDPRGTAFHEALHGLCVDSHAPVYIATPLDNMADVQIAKFIDCMAEWIYPVDTSGWP